MELVTSVWEGKKQGDIGGEEEEWKLGVTETNLEC